MATLTTPIGKHDFHKQVTVLEVPVGTLKVRDGLWQEYGWNHGGCTIPLANQAWAEIWDNAKADWEADPKHEGLTCHQFHCAFYIVKEGDRTSCGTIAKSDKGFHISG